MRVLNNLLSFLGFSTVNHTSFWLFEIVYIAIMILGMVLSYHYYKHKNNIKGHNWPAFFCSLFFAYTFLIITWITSYNNGKDK